MIQPTLQFDDVGVVPAAYTCAVQRSHAAVRKAEGDGLVSSTNDNSWNETQFIA